MQSARARRESTVPTAPAPRSESSCCIRPARGNRRLPRSTPRSESDLTERLGGQLDLYREYLDNGRFALTDEYLVTFRTYLRDKYRDRPDVVVAVALAAVDFRATSTARSCFLGCPVCLRGHDRHGLRSTGTNVFSDTDWNGSLKLALELQPRTRQVFVVTGASEFDLRSLSGARRQFAALEPTTRLHVPHRATDRRTRANGRDLAAGLDHLLREHVARRSATAFRRNERARPDRGSRECSDLHPVRGEPRTRSHGGPSLEQPALGAEVLRDRRAAARWRVSGRHSAKQGGDLQRAIGLATAAALEHRSAQDSGGDTHSLSRTEPLGGIPRLCPRRRSR